MTPNADSMSPPPETPSGFSVELEKGSSRHAALDRIPPGTMGGAYFEMWCAEINSVGLDETRTTLADLRTKGTLLREAYLSRQLTWNDLNAFVRCSLPLLDIERVDAIRCYNRTYFYQRARPAYVADYDRSSPPALNALTTATRDPQSHQYDAGLIRAVRADAVRLHDEITRIEIYRPYQEEKRTEITRKLNVWTISTVAAFLAVGGLIYQVMVCNDVPQPFFPVIPVVMAFGALGAAVSSLRRLQDSFDADASILNITKYLRVPIGIKMVPFVGAIFAFILLLVLTADILPQDLLPNLGADGPPADLGGAAPPVTPVQSSAEATCSDWAPLLGGPAGSVEYAKLLVYSFLAGFAERLVPDTLDRLVGKKMSQS